MKFDTSILREADIRGKYPSQITGEFAKRLGLVFGTLIKSKKEDTCVVGHDNRLGGAELTKNLVEGLIQTGINVVYIGLVTTPMLNFASRKMSFEYGIMVTASHNPKNDNGFKLFGKEYQHLSHEDLDTVYHDLKDSNFKPKKGHGSFKKIDISDAYAKKVAESIEIGTKHKKVVVDCGNGTASCIIRKVYDRLPLNVIYLYSDNNPLFPNHHPDPSVPENLKTLAEEVLKENADLGLAYDGDADRVGFVDDKGNIIPADTMMSIYARDIIPKDNTKPVLIDVKCTKALEDEIKKLGGTFIMDTPSSARQEERLHFEKLNFAGGYSNHIFFGDTHPGYDDGIYAGLRLQEILTHKKETLSEMINSLNKYYNTPEIKVETTDEKKWEIVDGIKKYCEEKGYSIIDVSGVRASLKNGWALIRASNTGPNLTIRFESNTKKGLEEIEEEFMNVLKKLQK